MPRKQTVVNNINFIPKRTSIGNGKVKMSSMNKHKRRSYKPYNRQGK